ncbi:hypothetical protein HanHA300_Chr13g0501951 [Helianthus annuus]|nr:hypothetical protein HanHA300_Chr13g0501951 [Helianthus annuus]
MLHGFKFRFLLMGSFVHANCLFKCLKDCFRYCVFNYYTPPPAYYYNTAPAPASASVPPYGRYPPSPSPYTTAPPPPRPYLYGSNSDPYSGYYQGGYYPNTQSNTRGYPERQSGYEGGGVGGPSVPVDYAHYKQKQPRPVRQSGDGDGGSVG